MDWTAADVLAMRTAWPGQAATVCEGRSETARWECGTRLEGFGIPRHAQSFFARLQDLATRQARNRVTLEDVREVHHTALLGPSGQTDLIHYVTRLKEGEGLAGPFGDGLATARPEGRIDLGALDVAQGPD